MTSGLGGSYNFVGIAPSIGVRALADFSGLCPLYWHQGEDFAVFSNRTSTIDRLLDLGWELRPFAWVIGHANLFDDHMPVQRVSYLPPGIEARLAVGATQVELARSSSWFWPPPSDDRGRDNLDPQEWDEITDAMIANFRALRGLEGPLGLSLTGGKDSRLCLALAHAAGLDDRIRTMTAGPFDSPEVACAATVAAALGFPHDAAQRPEPPVDPQKVPAPPPFNANRVWQIMRQNVYRYEGIVSAWSAFQNPTNPQLNIKGFGGELYRRGNAKQFGDKHFDNLETLASMFVNYHQVHDPLGVLQPREAEYETEWLKAWVYDTAEHVRIDLLPEKFYVDFRLGHWSGPLEQDAPNRVNVNPLLLTLAAAKNTELSAAARGSERFHFEVMRRAGAGAGRAAVPQRQVVTRHRGRLTDRAGRRALPRRGQAHRTGHHRSQSGLAADGERQQGDRGAVQGSREEHRHGPHLRHPHAAPRRAPGSATRQVGAGEGVAQCGRCRARAPRSGGAGPRSVISAA